ncbi:hypothetical protein [Salinicola salarius]|uniref:hypothetical protein n=1 Tax=Salinicola salarius TaxID=430457 RepID=UPI000DA12EB0|nr:hypothetical protein [Salinicola salarius]
MYLLQKPRFEALFSEMSKRHPVYLGAFRFPVADSDRWILAMTVQTNYWFLGAQRGGLRQFRNLETLQAYTVTTLGADAFSVHHSYPNQFPDFDNQIGLRAHPQHNRHESAGRARPSL